MFDAHNHFTNINSILCSSELLPQNISEIFDINNIIHSEIGLDRRYEYKIPISKQIAILESCMLYAKQNNIPITVHCVNRTETMISILREFNMEKGKIIWHGYNGSVETAKILDKLGILVSIGPNYKKDIEILYNSVENLLFETDYTGNSLEEHNRIINNVYDKASAILKISVLKLEENCINATKAFENRIDFRK